MKKIALLCAICSLVAFIPMQGQDTMTRPSFTAKGIDVVPQEYDIAQSNTMRINLSNVDEKLVKRVWSSYARTQLRSKVRYDRKTKQHLAEQANLKSYGETNLEYASRQSGKDVNFEITFRENNYVEMEVGGFAQRSINATNLQRNRAAKTVLEDFAREVRREQTRLEVVAEEKNLRKLESQLRSLKNANTRYHQEIKQAEERIVKAKSNISQNEKDQVDTQKKLQDQQKMVEAVKRKMSNI